MASEAPFPCASMPCVTNPADWSAKVVGWVLPKPALPRSMVSAPAPIVMVPVGNPAAPTAAPSCSVASVVLASMSVVITRPPDGDGAVLVSSVVFVGVNGVIARMPSGAEIEAAWLLAFTVSESVASVMVWLLGTERPPEGEELL